MQRPLVSESTISTNSTDNDIQSTDLKTVLHDQEATYTEYCLYIKALRRQERDRMSLEDNTDQLPADVLDLYRRSRKQRLRQNGKRMRDCSKSTHTMYGQDHADTGDGSDASTAKTSTTKPERRDTKNRSRTCKRADSYIRARVSGLPT